MMLERINLNFKISKFLKFKFEFSFEFAFEKVIYNEIRFKNDEACVIGFLEIIKINNVEEIERVLK